MVWWTAASSWPFSSALCPWIFFWEVRWKKGKESQVEEWLRGHHLSQYRHLFEGQWVIVVSCEIIFKAPKFGCWFPPGSEITWCQWCAKVTFLEVKQIVVRIVSLTQGVSTTYAGVCRNAKDTCRELNLLLCHFLGIRNYKYSGL